ncbi:hypothetical protein [Mesorhizobium sangaii]|uniref:Uncharacterized protein n=1 Tax=Mesorhizobium sangaii TaxID=505389 RepID=A0A841PZ65_9HYPH|nr:hypothetical protein [Mesorhizobium sangaii]MBB6414245.1 hypothetical protein [Mesorhizobium sangaii]
MTTFLDAIRDRVRSEIDDARRAGNNPDYGVTELIADRLLAQVQDCYLAIDALAAIVGAPRDPWPGLTDTMVKEMIGTKRERINIASKLGFYSHRGAGANRPCATDEKWFAAKSRDWLEASPDFEGTPGAAKGCSTRTKPRIRVQAETRQVA